jgi:hypothetical protein
MTQIPLRNMSATRNRVPSGVSRTSWGIAEAPGRRLLLAPPIAMAPLGLTTPGALALLRSMTLISVVASRSITRSLPLNSQLATKKDKSAE